ncbi:unnamed protein product [Hymenolepis diminuta]|uniref:Trithorax group protein osa n=1 Tax=Hymenolepis diminuta TaxID=6216 RepID=A0A0R3SNS1_HYMDI|nr:unnamed protein product [Hymenolepis diminuta]
MKAKRQKARETANTKNESDTDMDLSQDGRSRSPFFTNPPPLRIGTSRQGIHHGTPPPSLPPFYHNYRNSPYQPMPTRDYAPTNMYYPPMPSDQLPPQFPHNALNTAHLSLNSSPGVNNAPRGNSPDSDRSHHGFPPPTMNGMGRIPDVISRQLANTNNNDDPNQSGLNQLPPPPPPPPPLPQQSSYLNPAPVTRKMGPGRGQSIHPIAHVPTTYSGMMENTNEGNRSYQIMYSDYYQAPTCSYPPPAPNYYYEANQPANVHPNADMQFTSFQPAPYYPPPNVDVQAPSYPRNDRLSSQPSFPPNSHSQNIYPGHI